jgi:hypothetical protein
MKLLSYTYRKLALLLFLLMAVWGVLFYYAIIDEVVDETDDTLENYGEILMESALHDPSILETEGSLMSFYKFTPISEEEGRHYRQVFYDATVYIELEDEDEPVRVMCTAFRMPDGQYYELKLMISILERDDMVEAMLWYLGALFLLFLICTSIGIQLVLKGVFRTHYIRFAIFVCFYIIVIHPIDLFAIFSLQYHHTRSFFAHLHLFHIFF